MKCVACYRNHKKVVHKSENRYDKYNKHLYGTLLFDWNVLFAQGERQTRKTWRSCLTCALTIHLLLSLFGIVTLKLIRSGKLFHRAASWNHWRIAAVKLFAVYKRVFCLFNTRRVHFILMCIKLNVILLWCVTKSGGFHWFTDWTF